MTRSLHTITASVITAAAVAAGAAGVTASVASAATPPECGVSQLSATLTPGSPGAGNRYATLKLTNHSSTSCRTGGYVGLGLRSSSGRAVRTRTVRIEQKDVRTLTLKPGGFTRSELHWGAVQGTGDKSGGSCFVAPHGVLVTPPNSYKSLSLRWNQGVVCEQGTIDVTPLGTTSL